jgi:hypothetical protein
MVLGESDAVAMLSMVFSDATQMDNQQRTKTQTQTQTQTQKQSGAEDASVVHHPPSGHAPEPSRQEMLDRYLCVSYIVCWFPST